MLAAHDLFSGLTLISSTTPWCALGSALADAGIIAATAVHDTLGALRRDIAIALSRQAGEAATDALEPIPEAWRTAYCHQALSELVATINAIAHDAPFFDATPASRLVEALTTWMQTNPEPTS